MQGEGIRSEGERPIDYPLRRVELPLHMEIKVEILQRPGVVRIQLHRFFQVPGRFLPFSLPALDRTDDEIGLGIVGEPLFRNLELAQSPLVVLRPVIERVTLGQMRFR